MRNCVICAGWVGVCVFGVRARFANWFIKYKRQFSSNLTLRHLRRCRLKQFQNACCLYWMLKVHSLCVCVCRGMSINLDMREKKILSTHSSSKYILKIRTKCWWCWWWQCRAKQMAPMQFNNYMVDSEWRINLHIISLFIKLPFHITFEWIRSFLLQFASLSHCTSTIHTFYQINFAPVTDSIREIVTHDRFSLIAKLSEKESK